MGFGLLFIGYFIAFVGFFSFLRLAGYGIMLMGAKKLKQYNTAFGLLEIFCCFMLVVSLASSALDVCNLIMGEGFIAPTFIEITRTAEIFLSCVFSLVMLWGIRSIAIETDEKKLSIAAVRNGIFVIIYAVAYGVSLLPFAFTKYFALPLLFVQLTWVALNLILVFSCYAKICDENDVDMEQKPSRFAFVNEMRAQKEERERQNEAKFAERAKKRKKRK